MAGGKIQVDGTGRRRLRAGGARQVAASTDGCCCCPCRPASRDDDCLACTDGCTSAHYTVTFDGVTVVGAACTDVGFGQWTQVLSGTFAASYCVPQERTINACTWVYRENGWLARTYSDPCSTQVGADDTQLHVTIDRAGNKLYAGIGGSPFAGNIFEGTFPNRVCAAPVTVANNRAAPEAGSFRYGGGGTATITPCCEVGI